LQGELAPHREAILAFASRQREIESDGFIGPAARGDDLLGLGPFIARDVQADEAGWSSIEDVAAGIDAWVRAEATRINALRDRMLDCAGGRVPVLYGMGRNGRALLRVLPRASGTMAVCDDYAEISAAADRRVMPVDQLDPRAHYVCATPDRSEAIARRLGARGFARSDDWSTMSSLCGQGTETAREQSGRGGDQGAGCGGAEASMCSNAAHTRSTSGRVS
jgi:hypothetical protein